MKYLYVSVNNCSSFKSSKTTSKRFYSIVAGDDIKFRSSRKVATSFSNSNILSKSSNPPRRVTTEINSKISHILNYLGSFQGINGVNGSLYGRYLRVDIY